MKFGGTQIFGMPFAYACPNVDESERTVAFLMFVGETAWGKPNGFRTKDEIIDAIDTTLVAGEVYPSPVHWLEPTDFEVGSMSFRVNDSAKLSISSAHPSGPAVLFADWSVFRLSPNAAPETVQAMITIDGGEVFSRAELLKSRVLRDF